MTTKKPLRRIAASLFHYANNVRPRRPHRRTERIEGPHDGLRGNCTGLSGNCTGLSGNCTALRGDCSGLWGDCTGLRGDCTRLFGDVSEIPMDQRPCDIADWVQ